MRVVDQADGSLFPRFAAKIVTTALQDTPVVMVIGPRQCGKTTLVHDLIGASVITSKPANGDQVKTGQRERPGQSCFTPSNPLVASWFLCANCGDRI